jgi:hypothetical protein
MFFVRFEEHHSLGVPKSKITCYAFDRVEAIVSYFGLSDYDAILIDKHLNERAKEENPDMRYSLYSTTTHHIKKSPLKGTIFIYGPAEMFKFIAHGKDEIAAMYRKVPATPALEAVP